MMWDHVKIRNRKRQRIPVIRIGNEVKRYKSIKQAAKLNNTYPSKIKAHIILQKPFKGYLFDYQ